MLIFKKELIFMPSLQDALAKAGAVSVRQEREAEAARVLGVDLDAQRLTQAVKAKEKRLEIMQTTTKPAEFRYEARKVLLEEPHRIQEILNLAHECGMNKKKDQGGGRLVAQLFELRDTLGRAKTLDEEKQTVDRLFPKK